MKNATLLNHRGSKKIDRQTLSKIATPAATKSRSTTKLKPNKIQ